MLGNCFSDPGVLGAYRSGMEGCSGSVVHVEKPVTRLLGAAQHGIAVVAQATAQLGREHFQDGECQSGIAFYKLTEVSVTN